MDVVQYKKKSSAPKDKLDPLDVSNPQKSMLLHGYDFAKKDYIYLILVIVFLQLNNGIMAYIL